MRTDATRVAAGPAAFSASGRKWWAAHLPPPSANDQEHDRYNGQRRDAWKTKGRRVNLPEIDGNVAVRHLRVLRHLKSACRCGRTERLRTTRAVRSRRWRHSIAAANAFHSHKTPLLRPGRRRTWDFRWGQQLPKNVNAHMDPCSEYDAFIHLTQVRAPRGAERGDQRAERSTPLKSPSRSLLRQQQ
jgi:hypothetical protein